MPKAASPDMDCSIGEKTQAKVQEITQRMTTASQSGAAMATTTSMTPAQMEAMQRLTDPEYMQCPIDLMQPQDWSVAPGQKLEKRLAEIRAAKTAADEKWCETHANGEGCDFDPNSLKRAHGQVVTAASQYLADVQPGYAKFHKQVGDCIAMRDKPLAAARTVTGAIGMLALGADSQNWSLVGLVADAQGKACETAKQAASWYLEQQ